MAAEVVRIDRAGPVFEIVGRSAEHGITWAWARRDLDMVTADASWDRLLYITAKIES